MKIKLNPTAILVQFGTLLLLSSAVYFFYTLKVTYSEIYFRNINSVWGIILVIFSITLLSFKIGFFGYLFTLFIKYKPKESVSDLQLPSCTVIVPAYNEGNQVLRTLISLAESNYPQEKLQLIAIDDGSKDDTWHWIKKAKEQLGDRLSIYQQPENKGKRHALYRGFKVAQGEVFVTVDSDSIVKKNTLRNLVTPFIIDEKCGAVAGNVKVLNDSNAIIPKMLNVSFAFGFEFIRSAQSMLGSVLCTPGALAAYRKEAVMACLPQWINQTFMSEKTDIGEDRAMTNMILKQGYHVLFQKNAHVLTDVPESYKGLYKMFIRWERSNVRENIMMSKFAFSDFRAGSKFGPRFLLINQWIRIVFAYPFIISMILFSLSYPLIFFTTKLVSILVFSTIPALYYAINHSKSGSIWAYTYSVFYAFSLFWIIPYAIVTANRRGWLTRGLQEKTIKTSKIHIRTRLNWRAH